MVAETSPSFERSQTDLLTQRALQLAARKPLVYQQLTTYLQVRVQNENLLLDIRELKRVQPIADCTHLALAPPGLVGITYFQGEMLSVLDLGYLLGQTVSTQSSYLLMTRTQPSLALQVDEIIDLQALPEAARLPYSGSCPYYGAMTAEGYVLLSLEKLQHHPLLQTVLKESS